MLRNRLNLILILLSSFFIATSSCSNDSPTPSIEETPHDFPPAECEEALRGTAPAQLEMTEVTGVTDYTWNVDDNGIEVRLGGADESDLGLLHTRLEIDFSKPSTWDVVTEYRLGGELPVVQTQTFRPLGPDRIWLEIENVIEGQRIVSWVVLDRDFQPQRITLGKPVIDGETPSASAITTLGGVFETFDYMVDGQTTSADSWITAQGLDALLANPVWIRFRNSANDPAWIVPASEQARLCQGDRIDDAEFRLRRMALGCDDNLQARLEGIGNAWSLIGAVGSSMAITASVIALGVTGGATIGVVLIVSGVGAYYAQAAVDSVLGQNPGAVRGLAIDGIAAAGGLDGSAAKDFFGAGSASTGGGGGGAKSSGDPHVDTHDGKSYDFQAAGEFIAVLGSDFEIQVRQEPVDGLCDNVSFNTAVAAKVGNTRVAFYTGDNRVWVDGVPMNTPANALTLPKGVVNRIESNVYHLWWDSGEGMEVRLASSMSIRTYLPPERSGAVTGIFGNFDGDRSNDLQLPDGTVMPTPVDWELLVTVFADSWRVTSENSLFDYGPSEGPETFAIPGFPARPMTVDDVPADARASAETVCAAAGIMNLIAFDDCVLDVACTGDNGYTEEHVDRDPSERISLQTPVFLEDWTQEGALNNGNWVVGSDGRTVTQTINGDPTFFVSRSEYFDKTLRGRLRSLGGDDDYMGFVFGYQSPQAANGDPTDQFNTFVLSWKSATQSGATAGLTLAHANGTISDPLSNFWEQNSDENYTVIATDYLENRGWRSNTDYDFELTYGPEGIRISIDDEIIFDLTPAEIGVPIESGRFGFYNYSQPNVIYSNFTVVAQGVSRSLACADAIPFPELPEGAALFVPGNTAYVLDRVLPITVPVTIGAGALICMKEGAAIDVTTNGSLSAIGDPLNPIRITGSEKRRGTWRAIRFASNSQANELRWTEVAYGGGNALASVERANIAVDSTGSLKLSNVTIRESAAVGLWTEGAQRVVVEGLTRFTNNSGAPAVFDVEHIRGISPTVRFVGDNGNQDRVVVQGSSVNGAEFTWPALDAAYRITDLVSVRASVVVAAGAQFEFDTAGGFNVDAGSMSVEGSTASPVLMRAAESGAWRGIRFASSSANNRIRFASISGGGGAAQSSVESANVAVDSTGRLAIENSTFSDSAAWGVWVEDPALFEATGSNAFSTNTNAGLRIAPSQMAHVSGDGQYVGGNGRDAVVVATGSVAVNGTWDALDAPYLLEDLVDIRADVTIEAGASFRLEAGGGINVSTGMITAVGNQASPITFRGVIEAPSNHRGIRIAAAVKTSVFEHVHMWHGGGAAQSSVESANLAVDSTGGLRITNSRFSDSGEWGVWVEGGATFSATESNVFTGNSRAGLRIAPEHMSSVSGEGQYLGGNGEEVVYVVTGSAVANGTWEALDAPYLFESLVDVRAAVTIQAGASFLFDTGGGLNVTTGTIAANGTAASPITILGLSPTPGSHRGIRIAAPGSSMSYVEIAHGGGPAQASVSASNVGVDSTGSINISNSILRDSSLHGLFNEGTTTISDTVLNNNDGFGVFNTGVLNPTNLTYSGNTLGEVGP